MKTEGYFHAKIHFQKTYHPSDKPLGWILKEILLTSLINSTPNPPRVLTGGTREEGETVVESLVGRRSTRKRAVPCSIGRISTRYGHGGGQLGRRRARGE